MNKIYEKYKAQIDSAVNDKCVVGLSYPELIEILRAVESKLGRDIPLQSSCPSCVLDLLTLAYNLMDNDVKEQVKKSRKQKVVKEETKGMFDEQR